MTEIQQKPHAKDKALDIIKAGIAKKAFDPILIRLDKLTSLTDYFVILSGTSARHVKAITNAVEQQTKSLGFHPDSSEGTAAGNWALLDYGDVIVHVFQQPTREFYDLEGLWAEAPREVIPEKILNEIDNAPGEDDDFEE
jgi:ribosome-associated protein